MRRAFFPLQLHLPGGQNCRETLDLEWSQLVVERYMHASSVKTDPAVFKMSNVELRNGTEEIMKNSCNGWTKAQRQISDFIFVKNIFQE